MKSFIKLIIIALIISPCLNQFNTSICVEFSMNDLYFVLNSEFTDNDIKSGSRTYNYCRQVELYCKFTNSIVKGALIQIDQNLEQCNAYKQNQISFLDNNDVSKGIFVEYTPIENNLKSIIIQYPCKDDKNGAGCPNVDDSILWIYFNENQLGYTITLQVIGIIFMVLGIYIYRGTIVLVGASTVFAVAVSIQSVVLFKPGATDSFLGNSLILTGICSFFAGYVGGYFPKVGIFCLGGWLGVIISLMLNMIAFYYIPSNPANLTLWIVMPILALLFGILILCVRKSVIVFATSIIGAYLCLRALSWHLGAYPNEFLLARKYHKNLVGPVPWQFYLYIIALIILTASSSALQFWLFKKKLRRSHKDGNIDLHLNELQKKLGEQRNDFLEFKAIFKDGKIKLPRILNKTKKEALSSSDLQDEQSEGKNKKQSDEEEDEQQQQQPNKKKSDLLEKLVVKKK